MFPSCVIRLFIARDKQTGALSWRVLSHPKAPYRLCNFVPVVLLSALSVRVSAYPGSTRPLDIGLFGVSVRRVTRLYRCVIRLIPLLGYSGERPRLRRACKHPLNSAKPLQQLHRRSETGSSFRAVRILSSSLEALCSLRLMQLREQIALHVVHHARLAKVRHVALG